MDDSTDQFSGPFPYQAYGVFDLDMKRSIDSVSAPESALKKARWSPSSASAYASANSRAFENYGYGPGAYGNSNNGLYAQSPMNGNGNGAYNGQQQSQQQQQQQQQHQHPTLNLASSNLSALGPGNQPQHSPNGSSFGLAVPPSPLLPQNGSGFGYGGMGMGGMNGMNGMGMGGMNNMGMSLMGMGGLGMGMGMGMNGMNGMAMGGMSPAYAFNPQIAAFQQQSNNRAQSMNMAAAQGTYGAVAAAAAAAAGNQTGRTVYIGNLPGEASVDELLNLVHFGPLESVRVLPEKSCVFISFLDGATAAAFHADATVKKLTLRGQELKIGWGKASPVPSQVMLSISQSNASRNVYLGGLDESTTEEMLRDDLGRFGLIDQVKIVRDKNIGFVHFLSISVATKVVATLPTEPAWAGKRVNYGKDRCAYVPKAQQQQQQQHQHQQNSLVVAQAQAGMGGFPPFTPMAGAGAGFGDHSPTSPAFAMAAAAAGQHLNRTVYLGNIHPETSTEDLCNAVRGGVLQSVRYIQDKHIAFVTFVDPAAAFTFFQVATYQGLTLNNRRLKVGWGKNSGPLSPALALAVHSGATRNVYIGNVEDFEMFNEERLKRDFGEYGDVELVNFLKEKNCAFVNFTNISNAIKAIDGIKSKPEYTNLRIAHGKDRCANPPRSGVQGGASRRGPASSPGALADGVEIEDGVSPLPDDQFEVNGLPDGLEEEGLAAPTEA